MYMTEVCPQESREAFGASSASESQMGCPNLLSFEILLLVQVQFLCH